MAKVSVYDTEGKEHIKEPVDARECVDNLGWTMELKKPAEVTETVAVVEEVEEHAKRGRKPKVE